MSDLVLARNCCMARMLPVEAENGVGMNRSVREGKKCKVLFNLTGHASTFLIVSDNVICIIAMNIKVVRIMTRPSRFLKQL